MRQAIILFSLFISIIAFIVAVSTSIANAESMSVVSGQCIDMEYYDDILYHNTTVEVLGYVEGPEGPFDRLGNPDIKDVIREAGIVYFADFNVYESTVCIEKATGGTIYPKSYEAFNPWVAAYGGE